MEQAVLSPSQEALLYRLLKQGFSADSAAKIAYCRGIRGDDGKPLHPIQARFAAMAHELRIS